MILQVDIKLFRKKKKNLKLLKQNAVHFSNPIYPGDRKKKISFLFFPCLIISNVTSLQKVQSADRLKGH